MQGVPAVDPIEGGLRLTSDGPASMSIDEAETLERWIDFADPAQAVSITSNWRIF
jgi:hypothetical protein